MPTIDDLIFDRVTPDAPGLVLAVQHPVGTPYGSLRSAMIGRPGKQVLRWQPFTPSGLSCGPIWETRELAASGLLQELPRPAGTEPAADMATAQA